MSLPFSPAEFFDVFRHYNETVWPIQLVLLALAVAAVAGTRQGKRAGTRTMLLVLAALWLWMGIVYHALFFRRINPAAALFAVLFVAQAVLLFVHALRGATTIRPGSSVTGLLGGSIVAYGLVVYPLLGYLLGHRYPSSPTFGLPCPTTLFTLGVLLWARPLRASLLLIPMTWAAVGTAAAFQLGVREDAGLAVAALLAGGAIFVERRTLTRPRRPVPV